MIPRPATKMICAISRLKRLADEKLRKLISQRRQHLSACRLTVRLDRLIGRCARGMERGKAYRYRRNSGRGTNLPPDFIRRRLNYIIRQLPDWEGQEIGERRPVSFLSSQVRRFPKIRSQNYFPEIALRTWSFGKGRMATIGLRREVQLTIPPLPAPPADCFLG